MKRGRVYGSIGVVLFSERVKNDIEPDTNLLSCLSIQSC